MSEDVELYNAEIMPFDYSELNTNDALELQQKAKKAKNIVKHIEHKNIELREILKDAQKILAKNGYFNFGAWIQSEVGIGKTHAYNLLKIDTFANDSSLMNSQKENFEKLNYTAQLLVANPNTLPEVKEMALNGEVTKVADLKAENDRLLWEKQELERKSSEYKQLSDNLLEMINEKNNTISTIQFELGYERSKKQPEVVEKIVEKVVEVIPPNLKREVEQKQLNITNLTTQVQLAEKQISTLESEMNKLKSENAKLQDLKAKENEIKKTYLEVDNLKKQMSEHRTEIEQTTKLLHFYDKLDSFLATEMFPVVSQFTISRLSDQTKIKGENIIENLNNWIFAFTNKYLKV